MNRIVEEAKMGCAEFKSFLNLDLSIAFSTTSELIRARSMMSGSVKSRIEVIRLIT